MSTTLRTKGFTQGIGKWLGTAEVYDGHGRFVGNATDRRHVQRDVDSNRVRIELSFVGPMKFAGHYTIADHTDYRIYEGPANVGYAETLADNLIEANAYWPITGLTQRFFLMILPGGNRQMSLALMSRGEKLIYVVVGEYKRVDGEDSSPPPIQNGISYDLADDPAGGYGEVLLHRTGEWQGELATLGPDLVAQEVSRYREVVNMIEDQLTINISGPPFAPAVRPMNLQTNGWEAWSRPGPLVGSYSLSGGRAMSGQFHYLAEQLRVWRREVVSQDGLRKAVLHVWYRGGERIGVQHGVLEFAPGARE